jgi:ribonuclease HII
MIAGVDDAGRGPIIGPLVVAGISVDEEVAKTLFGMGVRDSKMLTPETRTQLALRIRQVVHKVSVVEVQPREIDEVVTHGRKLRRLNYMEAKLMAQVLNELSPDQAYVDASDVNEQRYAESIAEFLKPELKHIGIVSRHHADRTYPVVSAASIIAKVRRDEAVDSLKSEYGDFGSGYISDPRTIEFLKEWRRLHAEYPSIVRVSWKTIKGIEREIGQSRLGP